VQLGAELEDKVRNYLPILQRIEVTSGELGDGNVLEEGFHARSASRRHQPRTRILIPSTACRGGSPIQRDIRT
jgi:hypothetical protein